MIRPEPLRETETKAYPLSLEDLRGTPVVLACVPRWTVIAHLDDEIDAIRAQLRRVGAVMVLVAANGAYYLRPHDPLEHLASPGALADEIRLRYGHRPADPPTLYLLDGDGVIRFKHSGVDLSVAHVLTHGLVNANLTFATERYRASVHARKEWGVSSLIAGFDSAAGEVSVSVPH
jgi:hypothetical protein